MNKSLQLITGILFGSILSISAQNLHGHLMIVGGGSETQGGWSDTPYAWVVEKSLNYKVAIITTDEAPGNWLPDYFESLGAVHSRNFIIRNQATANAEETYDSLLNYGAIFFKGGDQWDYYHIYKGTLVEQAALEIFQDGGVLSGTSAGLHVLSGVDFIAENGTVYPEEALENPFNQYMTLEDDFLPMFPGTIFDSHVAERGRFGRILGFIGNWALEHGQSIAGIGVDDKTAFCIDMQAVGKAHGTGAVSIYKAGPGNVFSQSGNKLLAGNIDVIQLINNTTIDFSSMETSGFTGYTYPIFSGEDFQGRMLCSAGDNISENTGFLNRILQFTGTNDTIVIITGYDQNLALSIRTQLIQMGCASVVMATIPDNYNNQYWMSMVQDAPVLLFANNELQVLKDFLNFGSVGQLIKSKFDDPSRVAAFYGSDSRFAGKASVVNYRQEYASYDGLLEVEPGLGILKNTAIMPETFSSDADVENTATGIPFTMVRERLQYGIWIHGDAFIEVFSDNSQVTINSAGNCPVIFLENNGAQTGYAEIPASSTGLPRNIAGFDSFRLRLVDETTPVYIENVSEVDDKSMSGKITVYPNPCKGILWMTAKGEFSGLVRIYKPNGRLEGIIKAGPKNRIDLSYLDPGIYFLQFIHPDTGKSNTVKIIISK